MTKTHRSLWLSEQPSVNFEAIPVTIDNKSNNTGIRAQFGDITALSGKVNR